MVNVLFVFSFYSGYTPFSRVCGDCSPSTPDCSVWKTPGCVPARTFSKWDSQAAQGCITSLSEAVHRGEREGRISGRKSKRQMPGMPRHLYATLFLTLQELFLNLWSSLMGFPRCSLILMLLFFEISMYFVVSNAMQREMQMICK